MSKGENKGSGSGWGDFIVATMYFTVALLAIRDVNTYLRYHDSQLQTLADKAGVKLQTFDEWKAEKDKPSPDRQVK